MLAGVRIFANPISSGSGSGFLKNDPGQKKGISFLLMKSLSANVREVTRTPDLPLRRRSVESVSEFSEVPESRIKSHVFTGSNSPVDV